MFKFFYFFYILLFIAWFITVYLTHFTEGSEAMTGNQAFSNSCIFVIFAIALNNMSSKK